MKSLIVYFSHIGECLEDNQIVSIDKGNTEVIAEYIASSQNADLYRIEEEEPYPYKYDDCLRRARNEDQNNIHPTLKGGQMPDFSNYDVIYIGFPIWYRTYPRTIASFLDKCDLSNKTVKPFCTNDEGTFGISLLELQGQIKGANICDGLAIRGKNVYTSKELVESWLEK